MKLKKYRVLINYTYIPESSIEVFTFDLTASKPRIAINLAMDALDSSITNIISIVCLEVHE